MLAPPPVLPVPAGDPAEIDLTAANWKLAAAAVESAAAVLRSEPGGFATIWQGASALAASGSLTESAGIADSVALALRDGAGALDAWARALRSAQETVRVQQQRADDAYDTYLRTAVGGGTASGVVAAGLGPAASGWGLASPEQALDDELAPIRRVAADACDLDWDARQCRRALESTVEAGGLLPPWRANQSLESYIRDVITHWAAKLPVLSEDPETVGAVVWAILTASQGAFIGGTTAIQGFHLFRFFSRGLPLYATRYPVGLSWALDRFGLLPVLGESSQVGRALLGTDRTGNLLRVGVDAARGSGLPGWGAARVGLERAATGGGLLRGLGVVGGVAATGYSLANVASQGAPWDAYQANGAEYLADVAETGFNASLTSMMLAPSPWTVGATVVTGAVWGGLEIYNHWDDVSGVFSDASGAVADVAEAGWDTVESGAGALADGAKDFGSWLNPLD